MRIPYKLSKVYDYFILINLPSFIDHEIVKVKRDFGRVNGEYLSLVSKPHISMFNFPQPKEREPEILSSLSDLLLKQPVFRVDLSGYNFFPENNTFYISISNQVSLKELYRKIILQLHLLLIPRGFLRSNFTPHITIGRKLSNKQFQNALAEYNHKPFEESFELSYVTVLRREYPWSSWQLIRELPLKQKENGLFTA